MTLVGMISCFEVLVDTDKLNQLAHNGHYLLSPVGNIVIPRHFGTFAFDRSTDDRTATGIHVHSVSKPASVFPFPEQKLSIFFIKKNTLTGI